MCPLTNNTFEEQCGLEERVQVACVTSRIVFVHVSFTVLARVWESFGS